ncbi:MAG: universal stress protein [Nitrososphaeraceae archaeon]
MNADLIVMASSRSSSLSKRILGSTSRKVLDGSNSTCIKNL